MNEVWNGDTEMKQSEKRKEWRWVGDWEWKHDRKLKCSSNLFDFNSVFHWMNDSKWNPEIQRKSYFIIYSTLIRSETNLHLRVRLPTLYPSSNGASNSSAILLKKILKNYGEKSNSLLSHSLSPSTATTIQTHSI